MVLNKRVCASLLISSSLFAGNIIIPQEAAVPYPTMENIGIEVPFTGDDNQNASVQCFYRETSSPEWTEAMPLRYVPAGSTSGKSWNSRLAGSIFNLIPNREYEIKLHITDPDGYSEELFLVTSTRKMTTIPAYAEVIELPSGNISEFSVKNGTKEKPVVYRNSAGGAVIERINMYNAEWVILDGLTISGGTKGVTMNGAKNCVVQNCTIKTTWGITAYASGIENCYITNNKITGTTLWNESAMGSSGNNRGEGIQFTGAGNVISYNTVSGFRDCISTMEDDEAINQKDNDIHNNDLYIGADDAIEADFLMSNNRIYENRITNSFVGLSSQPGLGGPNYFMRNVMYNVVYSPYKFHRGSVGDVVIHNTVVKSGDGMTCRTSTPFDYAYFRNNLAIGGGPGGKWGGISCGEGKGARIYAIGDNCDMDFDAVGSVNGQGSGKLGSLAFEEAEVNGVALGNITTLNQLFSEIEFPNQPDYSYSAPDLRLTSSAPVIDKGEAIVGINENYSGSAPDIGAYEYGKEVPHYGVREVSPTAISQDFKRGKLKSIKMHVENELIKFDESISGTFLIFDTRGRVLHTEAFNHKSTVDIPSQLGSGYYITSIKSVEGVVYSQSFVK